MSKERSSSPKRSIKSEPPSMYVVVLLDDEATPYEWFLQLLDVLFHKTRAESVSILRRLEAEGRTRIGVYTKDIADTKCAIVHQMSIDAGYPLQARIERL